MELVLRSLDGESKPTSWQHGLIFFMHKCITCQVSYALSQLGKETLLLRDSRNQDILHGVGSVSSRQCGRISFLTAWSHLFYAQLYDPSGQLCPLSIGLRTYPQTLLLWDSRNQNILHGVGSAFSGLCIQPSFLNGVILSALFFDPSVQQRALWASVSITCIMAFCWGLYGI